MLISLLVVLVIAAVVLWAVTQLPLDPTIAGIIRVVVVAVLAVLDAFTGRHVLGRLL